MKNAFRLLALLVILVSFQTLSAQTCNWLTGIGGTGAAYRNDLTTDEDGNTYVTGLFNGNVIFGTINLTTGSLADIFVAKLNSEGVWQWAVQATAVDACPNRIRLDLSGNIHIAGSFYNSVTFGSYTVTSVGGSQDAFTAKLDSSGVWLWAVSGGGSGDDCCNGLDCDNDGNSYITGSFTHTAYFGSHSITSMGGSDFFVARVSPTGNRDWAISKGSSSDDCGNDIAVDDAGSCYIAGYFSESINIAGTILISGGGQDVLVAKLSCEGVWLWGRRAGSTYVDMANSIARDGGGNLYIAGEFVGLVGFGSSVLSGTNLYQSMFVAKLTPSGNWIWANCANGSAYYTTAVRITADQTGNCCVTGLFLGSANFGNNELISNTGNDIYFAKLTANGDWAWAFSLMVPEVENAGGIDLAPDGTGRLSGDFYDEISVAGLTLYTTGETDGFVLKFADPIPAAPQNLTIANLANDIHLGWDAVTTDNTAHPLDPDYYFIYYNYSQTPGGDYSFLDYTPASIRHYAHQYAGLYSTEYFYEVTAVKDFGSGISPDDMNTLLRQKLHSGMSRTQVEQVLKELSLK